MANLLDTIRQNNQQLTKPQGVSDQTAQLSTLLRAKSGKQVGTPSIASSSLGEQQAVAETNQSLQGVRNQASIQQAGLEQQQAAEQQQTQLQKADIRQQNKFDTIQNKLKTDSLLSELERNKGKLDTARYQSSMEQLGANLRLQNTQYIDNLEREGARARLDDDVKFKEEMARATFGDQQDLLQKALGNKSVLDANEREFQKSMAQMGLDDSYAMFRAQQRNEAQRALYSGIGAITTAGIGAYGTFKDRAPTDEGGTTGDINTSDTTSRTV